MAEWSRRRLLLAALGLTALASGGREFLRRRSLQLGQADLTNHLLNNPDVVSRAVSNAIEGDREATAEVERILTELKLDPPNQPYSRSMSKVLIQGSRLATEQYLTGKFDSAFDGSIRGLPSYGDHFLGYTQVASIMGPETVNAAQRIDLDRIGQQDPLLAQSHRLRRLIDDFAGQSMVIRWSYPVYWGYVLTSPSHHVLVLRGTQRGYEWFQTLKARQVEAKDVPGLDFTGSIHQGFSTIYSHLSGAVIKAARTLDPAIPLFVAGHSLGSPLASLAALDIAQKIPSFRLNLRLYTYAGPRLGNPAFAEAFSRLLPNSYRIVNLADLVPSLPPTKTGDVVYVHLGEPWGFTMASGDIGPNHFISAYRTAIDQEQEQLWLRNESKPPAASTHFPQPAPA